MDTYILSLLVVGILLLAITLGSGWISRLPFSYALIYLVVGVMLGPYGWNLIQLRPEAEFLERLTEFVVLISLFGCGLKINRPLQVGAWSTTIRAIGGVMPWSIFGTAAVGHWLLGFDWGESILLGAILAPTDPVLASEVQLNHPHDGDELRFSLTSEGGLNDALAFPFVYFGLHWLEDDTWQRWFAQWVWVDIVWAIAIAILIGGVVVTGIVKLDKRLQTIRPIDAVMENFIALGMILLTYGLTQLAHGYGFLAVFVAGVVARRNYRKREKYFSLIEFTEQFEMLLVVGVCLLLGALLRIEPMLRFALPALCIAGLLMLVIRPTGTLLSMSGLGDRSINTWLFSWFGIRGVGSLYYLFYAMGEGLKGPVGEEIAWITLMTVMISIVVHGITSTSFMRWHEKRASQK
ncbi:MAG TPA: sodium:proton antiporter [Chroococcidiopsis sp.]